MALPAFVDPQSPWAPLFFTKGPDPDGIVWDRTSSFRDERDPDCRACQEPERYDDHTCHS